MVEGEEGECTCTRRMSAPASARAMAIAWPIPRVPPVTRTVWPEREKSSFTEVMMGVCFVMSFGKVVVTRMTTSSEMCIGWLQNRNRYKSKL